MPKYEHKLLRFELESDYGPGMDLESSEGWEPLGGPQITERLGDSYKVIYQAVRRIKPEMKQ